MTAFAVLQDVQEVIVHRGWFSIHAFRLVAAAFCTLSSPDIRITVFDFSVCGGTIHQHSSWPALQMASRALGYTCLSEC